MSDRTTKLLQAHDPARQLRPLGEDERERLRRTIVATTRAMESGHGRAHRVLIVSAATLLLLLAVVGAGLGARQLLKTTADEESGLPAGSALFIGTHPTCTAVNDHRFHCVLKSAPTVESIEGSYEGSKMLTVDATKHIDGGCIARSADGLDWDCYLGQAAVEHGILVHDLLGQYQPGPSHG
jgi:hypothetical protein